MIDIFSYLEPYMTALKVGLQDPHSDVSSAALLALGETCAVLEVNYLINYLRREILFLG
jgi:hypothetical protein